MSDDRRLQTEVARLKLELERRDSRLDHIAKGAQGLCDQAFRKLSLNHDRGLDDVYDLINSLARMVRDLAEAAK